MKRRIAILGSTGSIGTQALDVVRQHRDLFEIELLTANTSVDALCAQALEFDANAVVICDESKYLTAKEKLASSDTKVFAGIKSACELVGGGNVDIVLASMVGFSGLEPTIAAIKAGKIIALANKETLVAAGAMVMDLAKKFNAPIIPVDSEHSAIFQCLLGAQGNAITRIHLTASGGPFRTWTKDRIAAATRDDALKHPNWNMGAKITVDSATMVNKGFEVMEAKWLFDINPDHINVVVHPESVVHSMVEFEDGAVIAQMGCPDMREPIQLAFSFPERLSLNNRKLDFFSLKSLTFEKPDLERFPALGLCFDAITKGGNMPCIVNAANEVAVAAYLRRELSFYGISDVIAKAMDGPYFVEKPSLDDIFETDRTVRLKVAEML